MKFHFFIKLFEFIKSGYIIDDEVIGFFNEEIINWFIIFKE